LRGILRLRGHAGAARLARGASVARCGNGGH
jgi:hypothetical protein